MQRGQQRRRTQSVTRARTAVRGIAEQRSSWWSNPFIYQMDDAPARVIQLRLGGQSKVDKTITGDCYLKASASHRFLEIPTLSFFGK